MSAIGVALCVVAAATLAIFQLFRIVARVPTQLHTSSYIDYQIKYQTALLVVACAVLTAAWQFNPIAFTALMGLGDLDAPANPVAWLGIRAGETWMRVGASASMFATLATFLFVRVATKKTQDAEGVVATISLRLLWVLLFAASNAFSEEMIYRIGILVLLHGEFDVSHILILSGVAFGAAHIRGMPNGLVGMIMAGVLGWFLAKSVVETQGWFWAWFLHFLQDVVIFHALTEKATQQTGGVIKQGPE